MFIGDVYVARPRICSRVPWMDVHRRWIFTTTHSSQW